MKMEKNGPSGGGGGGASPIPLSNENISVIAVSIILIEMILCVICDRTQLEIQQEVFLLTICLRSHNPQTTSQLIWDQNTSLYLGLNLQPVITRIIMLCVGSLNQ